MRDLCRTDICILIDEWIIGRNSERDRAILKRRLLDGLTYERIIGRNSERDRAILKRRLLDGLTYERLAEEFDMSVRQISNIVYKRQEVLFRHMPLE